MIRINENLEKLGIDGKEAEVYLEILKLEKATVLQLARSTGLKRTTIYHCLDSLLQKNLITKLEKDNKSFYLAEEPGESLKNIVREKSEAVQALLPDLKNIFGQGDYHPEIRIYRHQAGLRNIFDELLTAGEKILPYYISDFNLEELLGKKYVDEWVKKRIKLGIKSRSLRSFKYKPEREEGVLHTEQIREVKFLPESIEVKPFMCICGKKVIVISSKEERFGFVIESREFAEAQKEIFELLWNTVAI
jgi:HTH-type transcriptional regulator, sugar sensing transcriptional regulator